MEQMRLQKYIALAGIASRRKAEELIRSGLVTVNGKVVTEMGTKVNDNDIVEVCGKKAKLEGNKVYIMLNKPKGYVSTAKDQFSRKTVLDLVKGVKERVYPVGRLDYDTSGLLLLTNDGDFSYKMTHPSHKVDKVYIATVSGEVGSDVVEKFRKGIEIDGYITSPSQMRILSKNKEKSTVEITIHEGRNRQVRKMCEAVGHPVLDLKRISIGNLTLGNLKEGQWRYLTEFEVKSCLNMVNRQ
ncbi:MAG TPA: rRNA pseudouridine synthase [Clostridiaceae bacterium]|nr:rRNA pseudouridine synthase [Clostridiaceae bacterium]HHV99025.1 rRNA pseudouridine synthase [Clostridiaceae bacterium]